MHKQVDALNKNVVSLQQGTEKIRMLFEIIRRMFCGGHNMQVMLIFLLAIFSQM